MAFPPRLPIEHTPYSHLGT